MAIDSNDYSRLSSAARVFLERSHGHFIDGQWQPPTASIAVLDPSNGRQVSAIGAGTAADIDGAVQAAHRAFNHRSWRGLAPLERERLILRLAELIEANAAFLAQVESVDNGMPLGFAEIANGGRKLSRDLRILGVIAPDQGTSWRAIHGCLARFALSGLVGSIQ
jgi:phenylacetaldehyde dehydrogenase